MRHALTRSSVALFLVAVVSGGCTARKVDLQKTLKVTEVTTGWFDAGIVGGKNKLVPSISFKVQNVDTETVTSVQLLGKFQIIGESEELGSSYIRGVGSEGLAAGKAAGPFVMQSFFGYTGEQARASMLQHSLFKDAQVEVFGKYKAETWVRLGTFRIARQLLTR